MLIAIDLDGTLLDGAGLLSRRAVDAVRAAVVDGHRVVIATGRPPAIAFAATIELAGLASHIVGANGTIISDFPTDPERQPELVHVTGFDIAHAIAMVETLRGRDAAFGFALATDHGFVHERGFAELMPAAIHDEPADDVLAIGGATAFKLLTYHPDRSVDQLLTELPAMIAGIGEGFAVGHLGADAVEIGPAANDKGSGLRWLCAHLGVEAGDVIAIGDELNDLTMIQWVGHGVAVGNADPRVQSAADEIIGSHLTDGVAEFLERLVATGTPAPPIDAQVDTP